MYKSPYRRRSPLRRSPLRRSPLRRSPYRTTFIGGVAASPECPLCRSSTPHWSLSFFGSIMCPVCFEEKDNPVLLPCRHILCQDCASRLNMTATPLPAPVPASAATNPLPAPVPALHAPEPMRAAAEPMRAAAEPMRAAAEPMRAAGCAHEFDLSRSSYANGIQSYTCNECGITVNEYDPIYREYSRRLLDETTRREEACLHRWRRTGGYAPQDISFYVCDLCGKKDTR